MTHPLTSRLVALAGLIFCLALLTSGSAALPNPPLHPADLMSWWAASDPALALGALLRVIAMALTSWLIVVTACETVATASGFGGLARVVRHVTPAAWRVLVLRPLTVGALAVPLVLTPTALAPAVASATQSPDADSRDDLGTDSPVLTMTLVVDPMTSTTVPTTVPSTVPLPPPRLDDPTVTPEPVPLDLQDHTLPPRIEMTLPGPEDSEAAVVDPPQAPPTVAPQGPADVPAEPAPSTAGWIDRDRYVIAPGDSFWSIAAQRVETSLGRVPTAREIAPYWRDTVALNAERLPVADNPDLLFPGDEVLLPPS
jgi:hypothetical protein